MALASGVLMLRMSKKFQQQASDLLRLFLLHPVPGALDQMTADHAGAGALLHRLIDAGPLIGAPVLLAGDKARGHVDAAARPGFKFGSKRGRSAAAIPLQSALETGAGIFSAVERKLAIRQPCVASYR